MSTGAHGFQCRTHGKWPVTNCYTLETSITDWLTFGLAYCQAGELTVSLLFRHTVK